MKKVKLIYLLISVIMLSMKTYSQEPVFINSLSDEADGLFETADCVASECNEVLNVIDVSCANWDYITAIPKVYSATCLTIDASQFNLIYRNFCGMYLDTKSSQNTEKLSALLTGLIQGSIYKITFYQRNIKNELGLNDVDNDFVYNSTAYFKVNVGNDFEFNSSAMNYDVNTTLFQEQSFEFTAVSENVAFSIIPIGFLSTQQDRVVTRLAIDAISIELIDGPSNGGEDPIDVVTVPQPCENCSSFELTKNERYVFSGWVKQTNSSLSEIKTTTYTDSYIEIEFPNTPNGSFSFYPEGEIIDGWQRMNGMILVPETATEINIILKNNSSNLAFFDDIRVHPFNGNLKSFVYDQETQRLMAELDENNYATFYEYDQEGGLVRIKKETEKGVFTIQETRSSTIKKQ